MAQSVGSATKLALINMPGTEPQQTCLAIVVSEQQGIPELVQPVSKDYCLAQHLLTQKQLIAWLTTPELFQVAPALDVKALNDDNRKTSVHTVTPITQDDLDNEQHYIIGVGLNFNEHRDEVGVAIGQLNWRDLLFFPKATVPVSAYGDKPVGLRLGSTEPENVELLDYEIELGFLLLDDIDLNHTLDRNHLFNNLVYFASNDFSDREPIILDTEFGYGQAKSHPHYLPTGPWLVRANDLPRVFSLEQERGLAMELEVIDDKGRQTRQKSSTLSMLHDPAAILYALQQHFLSGSRLCMRDAMGKKRYLYSEQGVIPAGSLILTGTPEGVAIQAPTWYEKIGLFFEGGFSMAGARQHFVQDLIAGKPDSSFLRPGQQVEGWIEQLGRQRHLLVDNGETRPYGTLLKNADCSYTL